MEYNSPTSEIKMPISEITLPFHDKWYQSCSDPDGSVVTMRIDQKIHSSEGKGSIFTRVEFPVFDGQNTRDWIRESQRYFQIVTTFPEEHKFMLAWVYFTGEAMVWFQSYIEGHEDLTWDQLTSAVLDRFDTVNTQQSVPDSMKGLEDEKLTVKETTKNIDTQVFDRMPEKEVKDLLKVEMEKMTSNYKDVFQEKESREVDFGTDVLIESLRDGNYLIARGTHLLTKLVIDLGGWSIDWLRDWQSSQYVYDLVSDLQYAVGLEITGVWGTSLFDRNVMDEFEQENLISFDESNKVDVVLKSQLKSFYKNSETTSHLVDCIDEKGDISLYSFEGNGMLHQCVHEVLGMKYSSMTPKEKSFIKKSVFSLACDGAVNANDGNQVRLLEGPSFIKNKLAQVVVTLINFEYPSIWSSCFVDFLSNLGKRALVIDMFCRVLNALDDELISMDYPHSRDEIAVAGKIKDAMREQCVRQIVQAWYEIVLMYRNSDPELCSSVLDYVKRYISWIDIELVVNEAFTQLLFELILGDSFPNQLRAAAANVILAVVLKRTDPKQKLVLLQTLHIQRIFRMVTGNGDMDLVSSVASLVIGYCNEVLECYKCLRSEDGKGVALEFLNEALPSISYVMQSCDADLAFNIVQFLSAYVGTMKGLSALIETQMLHVGQILEVIRAQIRYDPTYRNNLDVLDKIGRKEEDAMIEFRKDLFVLLRNIGRVAPDFTQTFISNSLASVVSSPEDRNAEEVEAALSLLYELGESMSDEAIRNGSGILRELVPMLLSTRFPCHSNRLVALVYLDTITRYMKFVLENTHFIPMALRAYLDERGIHHPNANVSRRASYLFMRVVKLLKPKLLPYIETILQSLQDTVAQFTRMSSISKELSGSEDGSHSFEAIGLLIGMEDVPIEKQSDYHSALLTTLCQQVEAVLLIAKSQNPEESFSQIAKIQQIIVAINALSKGFSVKLVTTSRPTIGVMFKQTLDILLQILIIFPKVESLRCKVTSFLHRMVETLGASVFPYLPKALEQLSLYEVPLGLAMGRVWT